MRLHYVALLIALFLEVAMPRTLNAATLLLNASTEQTRLMPYDDARPNYVLKPGDKVIGTLKQVVAFPKEVAIFRSSNLR